MQRGYGIGFVGWGRAAENLHLPALTRVAGLRVVAAMDTDPARLESASRLVPSLSVHHDVGGLLADPRVDVVAVCVPPAHHAAAAVAALGAGRHVYLEKPVAAGWDDGIAIAEAARRSSGTVVVGHNLRSHRLVREARAIVGSGALGRIGTLRAAWTSGYHRGGAWPAWRDDRAAGGGAILEIGVHHLDLCSCILGEPLESVSALLRDGAVPDQDAVVTGRTASGVLVSLLAGQRTVDANEVEIYGEEGALGFSLYRADSLELRRTSDLGGGPKARARLLAGRARRLPAALAAARGGGDFVGSYAAHWRATGEALRGDAPPPATLDDGLAALAAALAAMRSAETGVPERVASR